MAEPLPIDWMPVASSLLLTLVYIWFILRYPVPDIHDNRLSLPDDLVSEEQFAIE